MKRYIDANVLKNYIWSLSTHALNEWDTIGVLDAVDKQPTEDVTPVVHAHWELEKDYKGEHHICSNCHSRCPSITTTVSTVDNPYGDLLLLQEEEIDIEEIEYCPRCGAKMDEKEN